MNSVHLENKKINLTLRDTRLSTCLQSSSLWIVTVSPTAGTERASRASGHGRKIWFCGEYGF